MCGHSSLPFETKFESLHVEMVAVRLLLKLKLAFVVVVVTTVEVCMNKRMDLGAHEVY